MHAVAGAAIQAEVYAAFDRCFAQHVPLKMPTATGCRKRLPRCRHLHVFETHHNSLTSHSRLIYVSHTHLCHTQVAAGYLEVANEAMCRPIRALTQMKVRHGE